MDMGAITNMVYSAVYNFGAKGEAKLCDRETVRTSGKKTKGRQQETATTEALSAGFFPSALYKRARIT